ncbi:MAG: DUF131 domain-containing protein [Candidatus Bathyarchaeia archaeon]
MADRALFDLGLLLVISGFALAFIAFLSLLASSIRGGVRGGGAILIGPIPIIFGTEGFPKALLLFALAIAAIFALTAILPFLWRG